jgi:DNA (cytosine-5)-methyltransferase 1
MRLLDLFCCAGGAAMGYYRAGFTEIVGVDIKPQPRYPFTFVQADALEYVREHGHEFDAIHASPPCQGYSACANMPGRDMSHYPKLVEPVRDALMETGKPWVIENVVGAPLSNALRLCGTMFGLRTHRHRLFEMSHPLYLYPSQCNRSRVKPAGMGRVLGIRYNDESPMVTVAGNMYKKSAGQRAMGIDWMTKSEMSEAIPPAYTEYIGAHLLQACAANIR